jgi:solute carrier family 44 (choline transporter-like protein), member 2/4/5
MIIAIMQMIKLAFEYLRKKYEKLVGDNMILRCVICCLKCCIWCLDSCVKFITKNAYIQVALTSESFCPAAWMTFWLIIRNAGRFSMVSTVGSMLMFIGKATIIVLSGWIGYLIIMNAEPLKSKVYSPIFPVIIIVFIAYLLASIFLSVFSFSATAILHCFIIDEELSAKGGRGA